MCMHACMSLYFELKSMLLVSFGIHSCFGAHVQVLAAGHTLHDAIRHAIDIHTRDLADKQHSIDQSTADESIPADGVF